MFGQLFGNYLVKENILEESQLKQILNEQSKTRVKLGTIAVAEKLLTQEQADEINQAQMQMDKRFGDIAVEKGYISEQDIQVLLEKQGSPYMKFLQLLVENTDIKISKIDGYIDDFKAENGFNDAELDALKKDDIDAIVPVFAFASKPYITELVALILRNITRFVSSDYYIGQIQSVKQFEYRNFAGQKCEGDYDICIGIATKNGNESFEKVAAGFTGDKFSLMSADVYDAVGEFVNCISGLFASSLKDVRLEIMPQFAYENQVAVGDAYIVPVYIEGNELYLYLAVDADVKIGTMPLTRKVVSGICGAYDENSKGTVVIVDDSGMSRKMLRNILESQGYCVVAEAADGMEGVLAYKQYNPDVITLDITMPNMSGTDALREIKDYDPDAKAVMITAAGQQGKIIEALKIGAEKFITKPLDEAEVIKSISEVIHTI